MVKTIYDTISKTSFFNCKELGKPRVLLLRPSGVSTVNIGKTTIDSVLRINPRVKLNGLNDKVKVSIRNKLYQQLSVS